MFVHIMIKGRGHTEVEFFKGVYGDQSKKIMNQSSQKPFFKKKMLLVWEERQAV